jgi:AraC-like DNA-binding protein
MAAPRGDVVAGPTSVLGVLRVDLDRGQRYEEHRHEHEHQLAWASSGVLTVEIGGESWVLPPTLALWIPAGVPHATTATRPTLMQGVYFSDRSRTPRWPGPTVVATTPLLRAMIEHLADPGLPFPARRRAEAVVVDLLVPVSVTTLHVPMPTDPRARDVAEALVEHPADPRTLRAWGARVGASPRTLSRAFVAGTAMTFTEWRTQVRLRAALGHLAVGTPVAVVAREVGYDGSSAFVAAFHRVTGRTPGSYFAATDPATDVEALSAGVAPPARRAASR